MTFVARSIDSRKDNGEHMFWLPAHVQDVADNFMETLPKVNDGLVNMDIDFNINEYFCLADNKMKF